MEEGRPPINTDEAQSTAGPDKKRGFLMTFQDKLQELFGENPDKSPEKEKKGSEKDPHSGRFRRMWGKLFGSIAQTETIAERQHHEGVPALKEPEATRFFGLDQLEAEESSTDTEAVEAASNPEFVEDSPADEYLGETIIRHDEEEYERTLESTNVRYEWPEPIIQELAVEQPREEIIEPELPEVDTTMNVAELPPTQQDIVTPVLAYEDMQPRQQESLTPTPASVAEERRERRDSEREQERKREEQTRKLKREVRKQERKVEAVVKKEAEKTREALPPQPERKVPPAPVIVERPSSQPEKLEPAPAPQVEAPKPEAQAPEQPPRLETSLLERVRAEHPQLPRSPEIVLNPEKHLSNPERVLKEVAKAAEHNDPLERRFEQSHEIKDVDSSSRVVPIGSVVQNKFQQYGSPPPLSSPRFEQYEKAMRERLQQQAIASEPDLYAAAVRWGFWSAIALLLLGGLGYLLLG
jgi:hypothetical protein